MNNIVFGADLSTLTLNNNCLVKSNNNNQNVVNISYAINFESTNSYTSYPKYDSIGNDIGGQEAIDKRSIASLTTKCNSLPNCRGFVESGFLKNTIKNKLDRNEVSNLYIRNGKPSLSSNQVFKNTLNMTNVNSFNTLVFSYIFIPTDQFYKFRVVTTNNNFYTGPCRIYLNNFQTVIFDSYIQSNETQYEVIKKGTYMICIDLPKLYSIDNTTVVPASFEFISQNIGSIHPDRITNTASWTSLDNLLIKNCDTLLTDSNAWTLVNLFTNSANEYCKTNNNVITPVCTDYYKNIKNYTTQYLNEKNLLNTKSIYPNVINGEYNDWSISDSNWTKDVKNLPVEYASCGRNASRTRTRTYYPPRYGGSENQQNPHISDTQTKDVNCQIDTYVNTEWTNRSCDVTTIPTAIRDAQFDSNIATITTELNKFNKSTLISNLKADNTDLATCYNDWNSKSVSSFTLVSGDETNVPTKAVMYSNVCYMNNYKWTHPDTTNVLTMQTDGNLVLTTSTGTVLWSTNTGGNTNARLCVLRTGKLVIYKSDGSELWSYDYGGSVFSISANMRYEFTNINTLGAISSTGTTVYGNVSNRLCSSLFYSNGYTITSANTKFKLQIKSNGAFYVYPTTDANTVLWDSQTGNSASARVVLQPDGNLVIVPSNATNILWKSDTNGNNGAYCELTNFGLVLIRSKSNDSIIKCVNKLDKDKVDKHKAVTSTFADKVFSTGWENCFTSTNLMYPELVYTNDFTWTNGDFRLKIQTDGNLVTYNNNDSRLGYSGSSGNSGGFCWLKNDGKLEMHKALGTVGGTYIKDVESDTYTNFSHLKFTNKGYSVFLNTSNQIVNVSANLNSTLNNKIQTLRQNIKTAAQNWYKAHYYNDNKEGITYLKENIKSYLKNTHWSNSPDWMFCRKGGQFFKFNTGSLPNTSLFTISGDQYKFNASDGSYKTISAGFRGWYVDKNNGVWNVTRRNLKHVNGYDNQLDSNGPGADTTDSNYSSGGEWNDWEGDKGQIRKANELRDGIEKPNYLPGYVRISGNPRGKTMGKNDLNNISLNYNDFPAGGFLISSRPAGYSNLAFPIFVQIRNKDTYANDIWDNHPELIENIIDDKMSSIFDTRGLFHTALVNDRFGSFVDDLGHDRQWTDDPWKNKIIDTTGIRSAFTNKKIILSKKSNFLSKINNALPYNTQGRIVENFINPICNLTNILKDPNCSGVEYDTYKQYVTSMDNYCNKNPLLPICTSYITKEIVSLEDPKNKFKINEENKIKILNKQESVCSNQVNYLDPRCISINSKKPEIIQKQILELDKASPLYKQLATNYGNEIDYQTCLIGNNIIETHKDMCQKLEKDSATYGTKLKNKRLEVCKQDTNLFHNSCIELNKLEQFPALTNYCVQDKNLLQKECIELNKIHKLQEVKDQCKTNKTDNCKQLCKEYKEDFNDICFWENNQIYFILGFIALIIIGSLIGYFKLKNRSKLTSVPKDIASVYALQSDQTQSAQTTPQVYADTSVAYAQQGMQQGMPSVYADNSVTYAPQVAYSPQVAYANNGQQ